MTYLIILIIVVIIIYIYDNYPKILNIISPKVSSDSESKFHDSELVKVLISIDKESLDELLKLYKAKFGAGAARYAKQTFRKWKAGEVFPSRRTFERFLIHLPKVMSYDLKCEVLRHLMEEYCSKNDYKITVFTDDWEQTLTPLVEQIINKPYITNLPKPLEEKLRWLSDGEMQAAQDILKHSQVQESKIAVSMLRQEFDNIKKMLAEIKGNGKITHQLKFPYGKITLEIKRR